MLLLIDNYDSFTYNLYQYFGGLKQPTEVVRNDEVDVPEIARLRPDYIVISAGPKTPQEAGISLAVVAELGAKIPILGVCLGHQCIGEHFGGTIEKAHTIMHGKVTTIQHNGAGIFAGIPSPYSATLYNSLVVNPAGTEKSLEVTAWSGAGELRQVMGLRHKSHPIEGVQFHPESILSEYGLLLLANFLNLYRPAETEAIDTTKLPIMVR